MHIRLQQLSVLGGAYLRLGVEQTCLDHYVVTTPFKVGRLKRDEGETLCRKVDPDNICDISTAGAVVCPVCVEIAHRLHERGNQVVIVMS